MKRKEQYADELIKEMEKWKTTSWVDWIDEPTKNAVIGVCQNVVESWCGRKGFEDHCKIVKGGES